MLSAEEQKRYSKQIILPEIGLSGQDKLRQARVLVIGAGGLGCPVLQYLTAAGVGDIGIADGDSVDITNLQRQVLYTEAEIGMPKAEVAKKKLQALNPHTAITIHPFFINSSNALDVIKGYDIVVDGSDNFDTRYLVNDACVMLDKPMVSGAIYKFEGQVSVFNYNGGPTYRCIFPEQPGAGESPNCADIGVVAALPGIIGTIQANEVIKIITGAGEVLSGKLLVIDTLSMASQVFHFRLNPDNKNITSLPETRIVCDIKPQSISYEQLLQLMQDKPGAQLVDVREVEEHYTGNIGGMNIPYSVLEQNVHLLRSDDTVILYCASGVRSLRSANLLAAKGFMHVLSLQNGISHLQLT